MPKFFCDYCDVYLTHDSQSGRKQHNRGRKHQENVRMFYTAFLRSHTLIDPVAHIFAPIPKDKHGRDLVKPALAPAPGERPPMSARGPVEGEGEGLAAYGIGQGGPLAAVLPGPVLLIQPSTIPPLRDVEPLKEEDIMPIVIQHQSPTIPINVPAPPSMRPPAGVGYQPAPPSGAPSQSLPPPPFRSLPPPPFPRPPPPPQPSAAPNSYPPPQPPSPAAAAAGGWNAAAPPQRPPAPPSGYGAPQPPAANGYSHPPPPSGPSAPRGPAINPDRMRALGLHGLQ